MHKLRICLVLAPLLLASAAGSSSASPATQPALATSEAPQEVTSPLGHKLSLKFHDEFDPCPTKTANLTSIAASGRQLSGRDPASAAFSNGEAQYYMDKDYGGAEICRDQRPNPFSFQTPGILTISAFKVPRRSGRTTGWATAPVLLRPAHLRQALHDQYGYIEGRFKLPNNRGAWPAFWLLGETIQNRPRMAHEWGPEVDVFEFFGHRPTKHSAGVVAREGGQKAELHLRLQRGGSRHHSGFSHLGI